MLSLFFFTTTLLPKFCWWSFCRCRSFLSSAMMGVCFSPKKLELVERTTSSVPVYVLLERLIPNWVLKPANESLTSLLSINHREKQKWFFIQTFNISCKLMCCVINVLTTNVCLTSSRWRPTLTAPRLLAMLCCMRLFSPYYTSSQRAASGWETRRILSHYLTI